MGMTMSEYFDMALEAALYIRERLSCPPGIALILGSGLGKAVEDLKITAEIDYGSIPHFPAVTVKGHEGKILAGTLGGKPVLVLTGRFHYYEGHDVKQVVFPVWVLKHLNINVLVVTNASGGINPDYEPGDIMLIKDHIGLFAPSPLRGINDERIGKRFPGMNSAYDAGLIKLARNVALKMGIDIQEGVYAFTGGPMYETPAEVRTLRILGADAVGMSTVPEVTAAVHAGIKVLGISCISNQAAGLCESTPEHEEVISVTAKTNPKIAALLTGIVEAL
jgi:purine-nucleoside phosphorylase